MSRRPSQASRDCSGKACLPAQHAHGSRRYLLSSADDLDLPKLVSIKLDRYALEGEFDPLSSLVMRSRFC